MVAAHLIGSAIQDIVPGVRFDLPRVAILALLILGYIAASRSIHVSKRPFWLVVGAALFVAGAALTLIRFHGRTPWVVVGILVAGTLIDWGCHVFALRRHAAKQQELERRGSRAIGALPISERRGPRYGRKMTWVTIAAAVLTTFVILTWREPVSAITTPVALVAFGVLCAALAVLCWDIAVVWIDYVSGSMHLEILARRWKVPGRSAAKGPDAETPASAEEAAVPKAHHGIWWLDPHADRRRPEKPPWWVQGREGGSD
jgi:hypothetical protein